jgi:hypothetical protein
MDKNCHVSKTALGTLSLGTLSLGTLSLGTLSLGTLSLLLLKPLRQRLIDVTSLSNHSVQTQ